METEQAGEEGGEEDEEKEAGTKIKQTDHSHSFGISK